MVTISFILTSSNDNNKLEVTLNSILKQKGKDYEIIIVDDKTKDDTLEYSTKFFQEHSDTIKVISSWKEIETANAWNLALSNAKGSYVLFLQPGYKLINNFMENIIQEINNNDEPDLIEFMVQYSNVYHHISSRRLKNNNLYHPLLNREVFALIHHSLFNKLFKRKIITSHKITFRCSNRFDLLFIYKILPWIETLYTSTKILVDIEIEPFLNFNSFDFLKQWVHIYNYYKQINLARELIEELEYAFVRFHYYTFLKVIAPTGNKVLVKKAIQEVTNKVTKRFPHWEKNQYLNLVPEDLFNKDVAKDWKKYLKNFV
ncbi:glycosyltransferase family 2 protein [Spiroplasma endosymbiont of 'Nebria riversi']|uniref:glycosyltransferase family 2 protein n=1 Tax=Spiroplasma endosymbiont of 'Nebria riversi' TaxID=2792084 RepID=UPI001C03FA18|nr:glycosyltransferase family 2 protein [Spiroplasma endosymbiont of 'Nebria riversi']